MIVHLNNFLLRTPQQPWIRIQYKKPMMHLYNQQINKAHAHDMRNPFETLCRLFDGADMRPFRIEGTLHTNSHRA